MCLLIATTYNLLQSVYWVTAAKNDDKILRVSLTHLLFHEVAQEVDNENDNKDEAYELNSWLSVNSWTKTL